MTKPLAKAEKRIDAAVDRWRDRLWLKQWDATIRFSEGKVRGSAADIAAAMDAVPRYKTMLMTVNSEWLEKASPRAIEDVTCHEIVHAVLSPLKDVAEAMLKALPKADRKGFDNWLQKENEAVTTHLEHIFRREARWPKRSLK